MSVKGTSYYSSAYLDKRLQLASALQGKYCTKKAPEVDKREKDPFEGLAWFLVAFRTSRLREWKSKQSANSECRDPRKNCWND